MGVEGKGMAGEGMERLDHMALTKRARTVSHGLPRGAQRRRGPGSGRNAMSARVREQLKLYSTERAARRKRKSPVGVPTNELTFTAYQCTSDELFPRLLSLYVAAESTVADVTYGRGVFWKKVPRGAYRLLATDITTGVDCRNLPYKDGTVDCVVFDPPYMHTPGGTAHVGHQNYEQYYRNNMPADNRMRKYHEAVLDLYFETAKEAHRVLRDEGLFIVKCADEVCANQQRLTHVEVIDDFARRGFVVEDLFVLVRNNRPGVSRVLMQVHARKNHSYFIIFRKSSGRTRWFGPSRKAKSQSRVRGLRQRN